MTKKLLASAAISAGLLFLSPAAWAAAPQPQYTVDDVAKSFATPAPSQSGASTSSDDDEGLGQAAVGGSCESKGKVTGPDGLCYPGNHGTAGFNLGRRMNAPAPAATPAAARARAPHAAASQQAAATKNLQRDLLITFKLGSAELTDQGRVNAQVFAQALKSVPQLSDAKFQLSGYTDASGRSEKNMTLSQARADAVKAFLVGLGVDGARLTTRGFGAQDFLPGVPTTSAENRRVVAVKE
jgi:outer membrane protein OmpA-like peptidoglycan-associated protein